MPWQSHQGIRNLGNPEAPNLYAIVHDNPETFADLDGHYGEDNNPGAATNPANQAKKKCEEGGQCGQPAPPAEQPAQQQTLVNAQDAARNNPNLQPTKSGKTFCNIATCQIAKAMGAPMGALTNPKNGQPALASQIAANLGKSGSGYRQVSPQEAQQLANEGKLVIGVQPHAGHGHIVTVRPGGSGSDPLVNNIGKHVDIRPASRAFYSSPAVKYYTPQ